MRHEEYDSAKIRRLLEEKKACKLDELMTALGTKVRMTVMRKLAELEYQTSYSHSGSFYTLKASCKFNELGLWSCRRAWFSVYGTLLETGRNVIHSAVAGYSNTELNELLHIQTRQALLHLQQKGLIARDKIGGVYVYFSQDAPTRRRQELARGKIEDDTGNSFDDVVLAHELKAAIILFFGLLNERQRRVFAGLESLKIGKGGDAKVARVLGIDPHTVAKGRSELLDRDSDIDRVRRKGGGRPVQEKKLPKS